MINYKLIIIKEATKDMEKEKFIMIINHSLNDKTQLLILKHLKETEHLLKMASISARGFEIFNN